MKALSHLPDLEPLATLGDARRLRMLRMLMTRPMTLTQIGDVFSQHAAWVRHHVKLLEKVGLVELVQARVTKGYVEKYYAASAHTFMIQNLILPESDRPLLVISGSHDLALEHLADVLGPHLQLLTLPVGSLDGLVSLRQGFSHLAGAHLLDVSGEYNTPYVRHFFPDRPVTLITLAYRTQGLLVAPGNPKAIRSLEDLPRKQIRFINRNPGSGTRVWFDRELQRLEFSAASIRGYENFVHTHSQAAHAVLTRAADVTLGIQAAAHEHGLDFIPLFDERYDLVIPNEKLKSLNPLLDTLQTKTFRKAIETLTGYSTAHSGERIYF